MIPKILMIMALKEVILLDKQIIILKVTGHIFLCSKRINWMGYKLVLSLCTSSNTIWRATTWMSSKSFLHLSPASKNSSTSIYSTISTNGIPDTTANVIVSLFYCWIPNILQSYVLEQLHIVERVPSSTTNSLWTQYG